MVGSIGPALTGLFSQISNTTSCLFLSLDRWLFDIGLFKSQKAEVKNTQLLFY